MTSSNFDTQQTGAADPQAGDPTPAANQPGKWDVLTGRVLASIESAARSVPGFVLPHKAGRRSIQPYFGIAEEFIFDAITAVEESPVVALGLLDPVDARERMERNRAIRAIVPRVRLIAEALQYTADVDNADLAQRAQKIYAAVKTLARDPKATIVAVRARIMATSRGIVRKKKSARKQPSSWQQQPQSLPAPNELQEAA
jgi:hypothetical protein